MLSFFLSFFHPTFPLPHKTFLQAHPTFPSFHLNFPSSTSQPFHSLIEPSFKYIPTFPSSHQTFLQVHPNLSIYSLNFHSSTSQPFQIPTFLSGAFISFSRYILGRFHLSSNAFISFQYILSRFQLSYQVHFIKYSTFPHGSFFPISLPSSPPFLLSHFLPSSHQGGGSYNYQQFHSIHIRHSTLNSLFLNLLQVHPNLPNLPIFSLNFPSSTSQPFHFLTELSPKYTPTFPFFLIELSFKYSPTFPFSH